MSNLEKYTLSPSEVDTPRILECWKWLLNGRTMEPVALSMFGDWFLQEADGPIFRLNILGGELVRIASGLEEFRALSEVEDNCDEWFLGGLVDMMTRQNVTLKKGQTYGYKLLPILGGKFDRENIEPTNPVVHQSILSQTIEQVMKLPPGTKIKGFTVDGRDPSKPTPREWWQFWK